MNLRQKRDLRRLTRQIIQIIFFLWMPALYTSAFSGVRYVIEQIRAGKPIVCPIPMASEQSKKEASVGIRRNRTETSKNEIYSVISLNADLCIRIYEKVSWN